MTHSLPKLLLALAACFGVATAQAGAVEVTYDAARAHTDAGTTPAQREKNLAALAALLREIGQQRLPATRTLRVELVNVDLTGTVRPSRNSLHDLRVITGRADGPRIELRYTLLDAAGATIASGQETLHDPALPRLGDARDSTGGEPLRHERTLLDHWVVTRFAAAQ
jgi:hypothetical protein